MRNNKLKTTREKQNIKKKVKSENGKQKMKSIK